MHEALLAHVRDWPTWVEEMTGPGGQAYAVLTVCRAACRLTTGAQVSKRAAAAWARAAWPDDRADLVAWAERWWYAGGRDDEPSRLPEVTRFVARTSAALLRS